MKFCKAPAFPRAASPSLLPIRRLKQLLLWKSRWTDDHAGGTQHRAVQWDVSQQHPSDTCSTLGWLPVKEHPSRSQLQSLSTVIVLFRNAVFLCTWCLFSHVHRAVLCPADAFNLLLLARLHFYLLACLSRSINKNIFTYRVNGRAKVGWSRTSCIHLPLVCRRLVFLLGFFDAAWAAWLLLYLARALLL